MGEASIQARLIAQLNLLDGVVALNIAASPYSGRKTIDIVGSCYGLALAIEAKENVRRYGLKPLQQSTLEKIARSGGVSIIVDGKEGVETCLKAIQKGGLLWQSAQSASGIASKPIWHASQKLGIWKHELKTLAKKPAKSS